jgi:hypothetical protein
MKLALAFLTTVFVTAEGVGAYLVTHGERNIGGIVMAAGFFLVFTTELKASRRA